MEVKVEPRDSDDLKPTDCILAKIKKEIEEDFAINEALLFDEESSKEEHSVVVKQEVGFDPLEEEHGALELAQHDHLNSCPGSKPEGSKKSLTAPPLPSCRMSSPPLSSWALNPRLSIGP